MSSIERGHGCRECLVPTRTAEKMKLDVEKACEADPIRFDGYKFITADGISKAWTYTFVCRNGYTMTVTFNTKNLFRCSKCPLGLEDYEVKQGL